MDDWWAMRVVRNQTFHSHGCQSKAKNAGIAGLRRPRAVDNRETQLWRLWLRAVLPNFTNSPPGACPAGWAGCIRLQRTTANRREIIRTGTLK